MAKVTLTVNGRTVSGECEDRTLLVHFIREKLGLTGTHVGCDTTQCGTCVVHMDGKSIKSCSILAVQASGSSITTIEGLSSGGELHRSGRRAAADRPRGPINSVESRH